MSRHDDAASLRHMLDYAVEAQQLLAGKSLLELENDRVLSLALARVLEVAGEAANRISPQTRRSIPGIPWREVIGMRNRLIHPYDTVDLEILWRVVNENLPDLIDQLWNRLE